MAKVGQSCLLGARRVSPRPPSFVDTRGCCWMARCVWYISSTDAGASGKRSEESGSPETQACTNASAAS